MVRVIKKADESGIVISVIEGTPASVTKTIELTADEANLLCKCFEDLSANQNLEAVGFEALPDSDPITQMLLNGKT